MNQTEYTEQTESALPEETNAEAPAEKATEPKSESKLALLLTLAITAMTFFQFVKIVDLLLPFFSGTQHSEIIRSNIGSIVLALIVGVPLFVFFLFTCIASWKRLRGDDSMLYQNRLSGLPKTMGLFSTFKVIDSFFVVAIMILLFSGKVAQAGGGFSNDITAILGFYNWDKMGLWSVVTGALKGMSKLNQPLTVLIRFIVMIAVLANAFVVMITWKAIARCHDDLAQIAENPEITLNKKPPVVLPLVVGGINAACGLFLVIDMFIALSKGSLGLGITGLMMLATAAYLICTALEFKKIPFTPIVTEADIKTPAPSEEDFSDVA